MKLLLISYLFPPAGGIAVQRALSLARYLPENGCEVHVLSARNAPAPVMDLGLLHLIPPHVRVHHAWAPAIPFSTGQRIWNALHRRNSVRRTHQNEARKDQGGRRKKLDIIRRVLSPDPEVVWRPFCYRAAARIIKRYDIDAVLITAPPFSSLLTGVSLKKRFPHITLISDFRDGWMDWYMTAFEFFESQSMRERVAKMERTVVAASDLVVSVTLPLKEKLQTRYSDQPGAKFQLVPNGFDPAVQKRVDDLPPRHDGMIRVAYMGTLYKQTSARYYLDALDELPADIRACFESHFIGRIAAEEVNTQANRSSKVAVHGFIPQGDALQQLANSDLLLVNMTDPLCHTGKIFEYLGTGKPILAFTPQEGELAQMLRRVGGAWVVEPADRKAALDALLNIHMTFRTGVPWPRPDPEKVRQFERPRLTRRYSQLIRDARRVRSSASQIDLSSSSGSKLSVPAVPGTHK